MFSVSGVYRAAEDPIKRYVPPSGPVQQRPPLNRFGSLDREEIKQLYVGDQKKVNESCKRGDVNTAIRYVERIAAMKRCVQDLDAHIKNNNLDIAKDVYNRAMSQCRRGNLRKAVKEVSVESTKTPATSAKIISFVSNTSNVQKGSSVILSWRTANANTVMLGRSGANNQGRRIQVFAIPALRPPGHF